MKLTGYGLGMAALLAAAAASADVALEQRLAKSLQGVLPDVEVTKVAPSPIEGLYELHIGADIIYMTPDGKFALRGDIYDLAKRVNLTDLQREAVRAAALAAIPSGATVDFMPDKPKHTLYVFTDVDCTYCRRMHSEISQLLQGGIAVRYLAFPRAGLQSEGYRKAVSVWCAEDQQRAMTDAKAGRKLAAASCENPVAEQFELGKDLGVRGTPAVYDEHGRELGGYVPADQLIRILGG